MAASTEQVRIEFSNRLKDGLDRLRLPIHSPTQLARIFNQHFPDHAVTPQTFRKWLLAEALPTQPKLISLAGWLCVSAQWLRFGTGQRDGLQQCPDGQVAEHANAIALDVTFAPFLPLLKRMKQLSTRDLQLLSGIVEVMLTDGMNSGSS